jgi:hypothetical protein
MPEVFCVVCPELRLEMLARASTQIVPLGLRAARFPFTEQVRLESRSSDQLRLLRRCIDGLATHCASRCCRENAKAVNREVRKMGAKMVPLLQRSTVVAPCPSGQIAYVASRAKFPARYEERVYKLRVVVEKGDSPRVATASSWIVLPRDSASSPQAMASSPDGGSVAMVRGWHELNTASGVPYSTVQVWANGREELGPRVSPPVELADMGAVNVQSVWWMRAQSDRAERLVVLWSNSYVHPMGTVVGANADVPGFGFGLYEVAEDGAAELDFMIGPFQDQVMSCAPTASGTEAVVLACSPTIGHGPGAILRPRSSSIVSLLDESRVAIDHSAVVGGSGRLRHPIDMLNCPSAAAISPSGDCVVAVHRSFNCAIVEVLLRTQENLFVSVQTIDVTHWVAMGAAEPGVLDDGSQLDVALKLPYAVVFSPCGRFAAIVDQRPLYAMYLTNHGIVVLDMALRHERRGVRAMPLAPAEEVAPRSVAWTEAGMWVQARFGALLLWRP